MLHSIGIPSTNHEGTERLRAGQFTGRWLGPATLGIYLVHPFFRDLCYVHGYGPTCIPVYLGVPLLTLVVYGLSVAFTLLVMQIPFVRRIAG